MARRSEHHHAREFQSPPGSCCSMTILMTKGMATIMEALTKAVIISRAKSFQWGR